MKPDFIYRNDELTDMNGSGIGAAAPLRDNYIYAAVNTLAHKPLYLDRHLHFAAQSYEKLYGVVPQFDAAAIAQRITKLLTARYAPRFGNIMYVYFLPGAGKTANPDTIIAHSHNTIYKGYEVLSLRPKAILVNYEIPFSGLRTAISLTAADYMDSFAVRGGANMAIRSNRAGRIISAGDYPVFGVKDGRIFTPELGNGVGDSAERELMFRACEMIGMKITEQDIEADDLRNLEEVMVFNHTGIRSVLSCSGNFYFNLMAGKFAKALAALSEQGF